MGRFYFIIILLQAYCLWHAYSNNSERKWYYLIFFLPAIGSLFYLYKNFYSRENVSKLTDGIQGLVDSGHEVRQLEEALDFSDTKKNRCLLAEAYLEHERYDDAIELLESCFRDFNLGNNDVTQQLVKAYYLKDDFARTVELAEQISEVKEFDDSMEKVAYAWSLHHTGDDTAAEQVFSEMDGSYCNYRHRFEFAKFLNRSGRGERAGEKLEEILNEGSKIAKSERRQHRSVLQEASVYLKEMERVG
jgi:hypothetical protein